MGSVIRADLHFEKIIVASVQSTQTGREVRTLLKYSTKIIRSWIEMVVVETEDISIK